MERSTQLLHELGAAAYAEALAEHRHVIREACTEQGGIEVDTQGDAFFFAFTTAAAALAAAKGMVQRLSSGPIRVRVGVHTGSPLRTDEGYVGGDVHRAARIAAAGHGGQVLVSSSTVAVTGTDSLRDLGEHRFKDFPEPISVFQLGEGAFPPLRTISNTNLPRPASTFVGRESELAEVLAKVRSGARLLTLTGPGGIGKTRLALEAATALVAEYKAGVFWVGLATLRDHALVPETIAQTLGAKDGLAEHIGERELLLLLDNLEQVIDTAHELGALLSACPNLALLVTSRELLRIHGEVEYPVPPLAAPEAVALFCGRAQMTPTAEIAGLCARLDSLPLAVELAAARTRVLSVGQILERLSDRLDLLKGGRDADPRQKTLRATIEWSYELLCPEERKLFAGLSVFVGGCTLEAAEAVCDADLDTLQSLVDKSLLRFSEERFWMLETIREFAGEKLEESGSAGEMRQRHADFVLDLAVRAEDGILDSNRAWLEGFASEMDDFRAARTWLEQTGQTDSELELIGCTWYFWEARGNWLEGRGWVEAALGRTEGKRNPGRAKALVAGAAFANRLGDLDAVNEYAEEGCSIFRALGDARGIALSLIFLGISASARGDYRDAARRFEEASEVAREADERGLLVVATGNLGDLAMRQGVYARAIPQFEEGLALSRDLGHQDGIAGGLYNLAVCFHRTGREKEAVSAATQSLLLSRDIEGVGWITCCLVLLASVAGHRGEAEVGAKLMGMADALRKRIGLSLTGAEADLHSETVQELRQSLGHEAYDAARSEGCAMSLDDAVEYALSSVD